MDEPAILLIEDAEKQRLATQAALEMRGFAVRSAGNVQEARDAINELGSKLAVMVIDMRLEDLAFPGITGADLGLEMRAKNPGRPPEFLILSAFSLREYYQLAVRLGVAAYLTKEDTGYEMLIHHIRALLIRRELRVENPSIAQKIVQISAESHSRSEAVVSFCQNVVKPAFAAYLSNSFVLLVNDGHKTHNCHEEAEAAADYQAAYGRLAEILYNKANQSGAVVLDWHLLNEIATDVSITTEKLARLEGAAFFTIPAVRNIWLSIGILKTAQPLADHPQELTEILSSYLRRDLLEPLLCMLGQRVKQKAKQEIQLLAHFYNSIAQQQLSILTKAVELKEISTNSSAFRQLRELAEEMRDTGQMLMSLDVKKDRTSLEPIHLDELIYSVLVDIGDDALVQRTTINSAGKDECIVMASSDDLFIAISRILQWFARRTQGHQSSSIEITCAKTAEGAQITFEDHGPRLDARLRQRLFSPLAQPIQAVGTEEGSALYFPLFLAKSLIEIKHGGVLEDRSDDLPNNSGHRYVVRFPQSATAH